MILRSNSYDYTRKRFVLFLLTSGQSTAWLKIHLIILLLVFYGTIPYIKITKTADKS